MVENKNKKNEILITSDMTIGEAVEQYPPTANVLTAEGIHCVGCGAATYETIEEGLKGHGKTDEQIVKIVKKMNDMATIFEQNPESVTITDAAVKELNKLMVTEKKEGYGLRVEVVPGGCSGVQYGLDLEQKAKEKDTTIESNGITVFIDGESMKHLKGAVIDYVKTPQGEGFNIINPSAPKTESCGCN